MSGYLEDDPPEILRALLVEMSFGKINEPGNTSGTADDSDDWPICVANMPEKPDNVMTVYGTADLKHGRQLNTGRRIDDPGFQIQIRSNDYRMARRKAAKIVVGLSESVVHRTISFNSNEYLLQSVNISSGPVDIGKETESSQRRLFSINGTLAIYQVS